MLRPFANGIKDFVESLVTSSKKEISPPIKVPHYTLSYTTFPYIHKKIHSREYTYTVKNVLDLIFEEPFRIDLMGFPEKKREIKTVLTKIAQMDNPLAGNPHLEGLNSYKQIVVHTDLYTGVFINEAGNNQTVLEITIHPEMK